MFVYCSKVLANAFCNLINLWVCLLDFILEIQYLSCYLRHLSNCTNGHIIEMPAMNQQKAQYQIVN